MTFFSSLGFGVCGTAHVQVFKWITLFPSTTVFENLLVGWIIGFVLECFGHLVGLFA